MDWKKIIPYAVIVIMLIVAGWFVYGAIKSDQIGFLEKLGITINGTKPATIIIHDTNIVVKYDTLRETIKVPTFIDRIIYVYPDPDTVKIQKVDSVFIERVKYYDLMLSMKKSRDRVDITAVNQNGKIVKEYTFTGVGNDFTAVSDSGSVLLRSERVEWNGINWLVNMNANFNKDSIRNPNVQTGFETGVTLFNKLSIDPGIIYDFRGNKLDLNNFKINLQTTLKIY